MNERPERLSGGELEYAFLKACGIDVVGSPQGPFAIYNNGSLCISRWAMSNTGFEKVEWTSWQDETVLLPFQLAADVRADLVWKGHELTCKIDDVVVQGRSYPEAVMRGLLAYHTRRTTLPAGRPAAAGR